MKRKQNFLIAICIMLSIIFISIAGYAFAKYYSKFNGSTEAQVAKWSFKVNDQEEGAQTFNLVNTINENTSIEKNHVAPGTNGYFDLKLDATGSEVAVNYIVNCHLENKPENMHFYVDENYTTEIEVIDNSIVLNDFIPLQEVSEVKNVRIYWNWPIETGNTEEEIFKNNLIDTESMGKDMTVNVMVTGIQMPPETQEASYKVYHYLENANDDNFTLYTTSSLVNFTETEITLSNISIDIPNAKYAYGSATANGEHITNIQISEDGTTNVYLYYLRDRFTLTTIAQDNIAKVTSTGLSTGTSNDATVETEDGEKVFEQSETTMVTKYKWGESVTITATPAEIEGYTTKFESWQASLVDLGTSYNPTAATTTITMPLANVEIKATGSKVANTYTVKFDSNEGQGTMADQQFTFDVEQVLTQNAFTKTGYVFANWNTMQDGTGTSYTNEQVVKNLVKTANGSITLYAQWNPNEYTISFNANGGNGSMFLQTLKYDEAQSLFKNEFTRPGYTFTGWNLAQNGTGIGYANEEKVLNLTATANQNIVMYAQWSANSYTVEFDANGGNGTMQSQVFTYDVARVLRTNTFTKPGYTFVGWNTDKSKTEAQYLDKQEVANIATTGTVKLYAIWAKNNYTIVYDANNGLGAMENTICEYDVTTKLTENAYTREGYTFKNWNTSKDGNGTSYENSSEVRNLTQTVNGTVTLYAQWTPNTYRINFNSNTGNGSMSAQQCTYDVAQNLAENKFTKTGYTFNGWSTTASGTDEGENLAQNYNNKQEIINLVSQNNGSITLYAQWKANTNTAYTVSHNVMNTNGEYNEVLVENLTGTTDSELIINNLVKTETAYNVPNGIYCIKAEATSNSSAKKTFNNLGTAITTIAPDGTLTIKIYYARTYGYLTTVAGNNVTKVTEQNNKKYYYGSTIDELTATMPYEQGYLINFDKWESNNSAYLADITTNPITNLTWPAMPEGTEITLTAKANKVESNQTPYTVNYYLENANDEEYTLYSKTTLAGTTNDTITESMVDINLANCTIANTDITSTTVIKADGSTVVNVYYDRNTFNLKVAGNENVKSIEISTQNEETVDNTSPILIEKVFKWGETVNLEAIINNDEGYTYQFIGWQTTSVQDLGANYNETALATQIIMPAEATEITAVASKTANTYKVAFNPNSATGTMAEQEFVYDVAQKLTANAFVKNGYTFKGWATEETIEKLNNGTIEIEDAVVYENEEEVINLSNKANEVITLYAVWKDETAPVVEALAESTTNSITANLTVVETGSGLKGEYVYYIGTKENDVITYGEGVKTESTTYTFEGLNDNTEYFIKVEVADKSENTGILADVSVTTKELIGEVTFTDEYWSNGKYILTANTNAVDENGNTYEMQYQVLTAEEIADGNTFDENKNWEDETIETGTVLGLGTVEAQTQVASEDGKENNSVVNTLDNMVNEALEGVGNSSNESSTTNTNIALANNLNEDGTINIILKDGDILYARVYDGVNGAQSYSYEIINPATKTYTEPELAKLPYAKTTTSVDTFDILTYETAEDAFKVNVQKEIVGTKTYNYYAKSNEEDEYKLISTSTNWNDSADVSNVLLNVLGKDELEVNQTYKVKVVTLDESGKTMQCLNTATIITKSPAEVGSSYAENRTYIDDKNYTAVIPAGFSVSSGEGENTISSGMVLKDASGNEFVWVPVNHAIAYSGAGATIPTNTTNGNVYYKPMAIEQSASPGSYEGMTYGNSGVKTYKSTATGIGNPHYKEPSLITNNANDGYTWNVISPKGTVYDASSANYLDILGFSSVQEYGNYINKEYKNMVNSTNNFGGFYIGRYETSLNGDKVESKSNKIPMSNIDWYNLYLNQDSNRNSDNTYYNNSSVTSSMIWGSQYDSMVNWVINGTDKSKVQSNIYGNKTNAQSLTGTYEDDVVNNIYDLISNTYEWTQNAYNMNKRLLRGGTFDKSSTLTLTSRNTSQSPTDFGTGLGSRLTLYIKTSSDQTSPSVKITETEITANTIKVKVEGQDKGSGIKTYHYSISTDQQNWQEYTFYGTEYTFTGLTANTTYYIKVQSEDIAGNMSIADTKNVITENVLLEEGAIYVLGKVGSNGNGIVNLGVREDYASQGYTIEYQVKVADSTTVNNENGRYAEFSESNEWLSGNVVKGLYENDIIYARLTDGNNTTPYTTINVTDLEAYSEIYQETKSYTDENGDVAYIPAGFKVGTSSGINKVDNGLVIQDELGNEFVWVPVESALANGTTYPTSSTSTSTYKPMAKMQANSSEYYEGLLYSYSSSAKTKSYVNTGYKLGVSSYREPSLITGSSDDGYTWDLESLAEIVGTSYDNLASYYKTRAEFSSSTEFGKYMNEEYKNMIDSVEEYKGFYVARYETSLNGKIAQSQLDKTLWNNTTSNWWHLYYYQDSNRYSGNTYYNSSSVTTSMIWGSQYDAMLNWLLEKNSSIMFDSTIGNHTTQVANSGQFMNDLVNNIFDLSANLKEYTQKSYSTNSRSIRGGSFYKNSSYTGNNDMVYRNYWNLVNASSNYDFIGTRMALYLTKQSDNTKPIISQRGEIIAETNSLTLKVSATDENSGIEKYHYYISTDGINYTEQIGWGNIHKFEALTPSTTYYMYATVEDKAGNVSEPIDVVTKTTNSFDAIDNIITSRVYGSEPDGRVYLGISSEYEKQGYYVQYQIVKSGKTFNVNGTWKNDTTSTAKGLSVGDSVYARINDGNGNILSYMVVNVTELETFGTAYTKTETYTDSNGDTAVIPKGFSVGQTSTINTIDKGLVVQDENGNQFVWVPVDKDTVVYDGRTVATDGTENYKPMVQYQSGYNETSENQYFESIRYDYNKNYQTGSKQAVVSNSIIGHQLGTSSYREPSLVTNTANYSWVSISGNNYDALSKYYKDILGFSSSSEFGAYMNDEYTKMVQSIKENGGFYIGRYETSLANGVVGSKINVTPMDSRAPTSNIPGGANTWYGEYYYQDSNRCETNPYYGSEVVTSSMIWGSQYDSMLNWALKGEDSNMVYKITGNHSGSRAVTGAWGVDIMNNIFDLSSNCYEWTQEAGSTSHRVLRGGDYTVTNSSVACYRGNGTPVGQSVFYSSRLILYIHSTEP